MRLRRTAALLAAVALAGCSATKVAYDHLDWLASIQVGKYVDLEGTSKALFDREFETLWQWHRGTQLALYSKDLRELARAAQQPLTPEQVREYAGRVNQHGLRLFDEALPAVAQVFVAMDDAQAAKLVENINEKRTDRAHDESGFEVEDYRRRDVKEMVKSLKRWVGALTPAQKQRVEAWAGQRRYQPDLSRAYWDHWMQRFQALLAARAQPEFGARLRAQFTEPRVDEREAYNAMRDFNGQRTLDLLADLSRTLEPEQRQHFKVELEDLAADLDTLATESRQAALAAIIG